MRYGVLFTFYAQRPIPPAATFICKTLHFRTVYGFFRKCGCNNLSTTCRSRVHPGCMAHPECDDNEFYHCTVSIVTFLFFHNEVVRVRA